jgi:hypothetical protein
MTRLRMPRSLTKHQCVFGVVYRPRLEATLTQKQSALDGRDTTVHVLNDSPMPAVLAATNKCLARNNKSRMRAETMCVL